MSKGNLIESGLPSAIYLLSIPEEITGYKIDKILGLGSRSTKIYEWINGTNGRKGLIKNGYLIKSEEPKGYIAKMEPIIALIENEVKISKKDRKILIEILDSSEFRAFVKRKIIPNLEFPSDIRSFYGSDILIEQISLISGIGLAVKFLGENSPEKMEIEDITKDMASILPEEDKYYFSNSFYLLSDEFLEEMSEQSESGYWTYQILTNSWFSIGFGALWGIEICRRLFKDNKEVQEELNNTERLQEINEEIRREVRDQFKK